MKVSDAGSYSVVASNSVGSAECMAAVTVKGELSLKIGFYICTKVVW